MNYSSCFTELSYDELYSIDGGGDRAGLVVSGLVTAAGGVAACFTGPVLAGAAIIGVGGLFIVAAVVY